MADNFVARHNYLTDGVGEKLGLIRWTGERCPVCSPATEDARLGVTHDAVDRRHETVQCVACDYVLTRPRRDPIGRRMNEGAGGGNG